MPRTEFHRPNPLDSDVIMDATARLLAPRRAPRSPAAPQRSEAPTSSAGGQRRKKKRGQAQPSGTQQAVETAQSSRKAENTASRKSARPAPEKKRSSRSGGRRDASLDGHRHQHKDSTEQPSLMKPYYLDMGK